MIEHELNAVGSLKTSEAQTAPLGADIWLHKTIPTGGGLGGGMVGPVANFAADLVATFW